MSSQKPFAVQAATLMSAKTSLGWDDTRLEEQIRMALNSAYNEGLDDAPDECDCPEIERQVLDTSRSMVRLVGRIRDIRGGIILSADLAVELDKLCDLAREKAHLFGMLP